MIFCQGAEMPCDFPARLLHYGRIGRIWWNWQTRYFEVVVPQGVQVQVLLCAPFLLGKLMTLQIHAQIPHSF